MRYQAGERVSLVYTDDLHTTLVPDDRGTVICHDETTGTVDISWDNGSPLSMLPDAGDRIRSLRDGDDSADTTTAGR
jgi:hypothetical protein